MNEGQTRKRVTSIPEEVFLLFGVSSVFLLLRYYIKSKSVFRYFGIRFIFC